MKKIQRKISKWLWRLKAWIDDHMPFICANCNHVRFEKDKIMVQHRTAGYVPLCGGCYKQIYNPWTEDNEI